VSQKLDRVNIRERGADFNAKFSAGL